MGLLAASMNKKPESKRASQIIWANNNVLAVDASSGIILQQPARISMEKKVIF